MIVALLNLSLMLAKTYHMHRSMKLREIYVYETDGYTNIVPQHVRCRSLVAIVLKFCYQHESGLNHLQYSQNN
jgi:hypothetical protein